MAKRQRDRLPAKILGYFEANPDEELSYADMATKFGVTVDQIRMAMRTLMHDAPPVLESVHVIRTRRKGMGLDG